jgi:DNA-binding NtrC family response regulator
MIPAGNYARILLADGDAERLSRSTQALRRQGYDVTSVATAEAAAAAAKAAWDVVVLDPSLRGAPSADLVALLLEQDPYAEVVAVGDEAQAAREGAQQSVPARASDDDLLAAVDEASRRRSRRRRVLVAVSSTVPLAERPADVELLALHFLDKLSVEIGRRGLALSGEALASLQAYPWPGQVRELRDAVERAVLLSRGAEVLPGDLPREVRNALHPEPPPPVRLEDIIRRHVLEIFQVHHENVTRTALALGISRVALRRRLREYGAARMTPPRGIASTPRDPRGSEPRGS